jgi:putative endonuclease
VAWVYVIQNPDGRFYIGMTTDLEQRFEDHNSGVFKWTKYRGPWKRIWTQECATVGEARKLENKLKRQGRGSGFYRMIGLAPPSGAPAGSRFGILSPQPLQGMLYRVPQIRTRRLRQAENSRRYRERKRLGLNRPSRGEVTLIVTGGSQLGWSWTMTKEKALNAIAG